MEEVLAALGGELRLLIIEALIQNGPTKQAALGERLNALPGSMSKAIKELRAAGLITKDRPRGECALAHPAATKALVQAGADLAYIVAKARVDAADDRAARLRRGSLRAVEPETGRG